MDETWTWRGNTSIRLTPDVNADLLPLLRSQHERLKRIIAAYRMRTGELPVCIVMFRQEKQLFHFDIVALSTDDWLLTASPEASLALLQMSHQDVPVLVSSPLETVFCWLKDGAKIGEGGENNG